MPSIVDKSNVTKICVDDFAIRKRKSYGTVMVDLITHRIIDLLPSRDSKDVKQWLSTFPNIELVARDGAVIYSSAISKSHPNAVQVSDRFHLIKGLAEAINRIIIRLYPARLEIPNIQEVPKEVEVLYNTANRSQRIRFAQKKVLTLFLVILLFFLVFFFVSPVSTAELLISLVPTLNSCFIRWFSLFHQLSLKLS